MVPSSPLYEFGPFVLDPNERRLTRLGEPVAIAPKCFDLLVVLVENGDHLLDKKELLARLWPDQFVEESSLSFQVSGLRKVLGEGVNGEHYLETVPKKGFRFVATIAEHQSTNGNLLKPEDGALPTERGEETPPVKTTTNEMANRDSASHPLRTRWPIVVVFSVLIIGALGLVYALWTRRAVASASPIRTIAVLPFKPIGADSRNESLEMGLAATMIGRLNGIKQIVVRQISDVRKYTDVHQDSLKAGQELQVEAVLDGSIQKDGNRVRVRVRLIKVDSGVTLWDEKFDKDCNRHF